MAKFKKRIIIKIFIKDLLQYILSLIMWFPSKTLRRLTLKLCLGNLGNGCVILRNVEIRNPKNIYIQDNCVINPKVLLDGRGGKINIETSTDIAQETNIWTLSHNPNDNQHGTVRGDVIIMDHVWIGSRVTIMPGIKIGRGAVVGTGSIVTKDVPEKTIVAGIPAKKIGMRNNPLTYKLYSYSWFK